MKKTISENAHTKELADVEENIDILTKYITQYQAITDYNNKKLAELTTKQRNDILGLLADINENATEVYNYLDKKYGAKEGDEPDNTPLGKLTNACDKLPDLLQEPSDEDEQEVYADLKEAIKTINGTDEKEKKIRDEAKNNLLKGQTKALTAEVAKRNPRPKVESENLSPEVNAEKLKLKDIEQKLSQENQNIIPSSVNPNETVSANSDKFIEELAEFLAKELKDKKELTHQDVTEIKGRLKDFLAGDKLASCFPKAEDLPPDVMYN